jgi:predicted MFS family arabinose efflux permease
MLYMAKGTAAALVPVASIAATTYGWSAVFAAAIAFNVMAALLAIIALKPLKGAVPPTERQPCCSRGHSARGRGSGKRGTD